VFAGVQLHIMIICSGFFLCSKAIGQRKEIALYFGVWVFFFFDSWTQLPELDRPGYS